MGETFVLELLPARGLDQSMLLPVLVGLIVVLICTETLGWVFAGAVVPGYLASVLVIQPVTGAIVVFESLVTLALAAMLAKGLSKTDAWTRFFGRERFFLILVVSLVVRMHDHAWFAPWAIGHIDVYLESTYETQQEFYSVGLVLVPLTANMLWKPAIHRGLMQLGVQVGITFLLVKFILLPYTNLSLSSVELTYENAAINFVGHAKAHIILLTAALLAAQFNLTYGWDFNGILVPALLAMLWLTPYKLGATLGEAVLVYYMTKGFLRLPYIRHMDFEGPRKIVLVFSLAFAWKLALGFTLAPIFPTLKISDTYGFGYLLSSLLAVKMLGRKSIRSVMLPALFASAGGFVIGSLAGFMLELIAPQRPPVSQLTEPESARLTSSPLGVMTLARMDFQARPETPESPDQFELGVLEDFWSLAADIQTGQGARGFGVFARPGEGSVVDDLRQLGASLGLQVVELGRYPVGEAPAEDEQDLRPRRDWLGVVAQGSGLRRGFATGLIVPEAEGPVLVVPMPSSEAPIAETAAAACRRVDCRAVLVAGHELTSPGTAVSPRPLEVAMAAFRDLPIVVMRGEPELELGPGVKARIHQLRGKFNLVELWPGYKLDWDTHETAVRPPPGEGDFVLLRTTLAELGDLGLAWAQEFEREADPSPASLDLMREREVLRSGELASLLREIEEKREPPGSAGAGYRAPSAAELLALEQLVVEPLLDWAEGSELGTPIPPSIPIYAEQLDYTLRELGECDDPAKAASCVVVLHERENPTTAGWGTLIVRRQSSTQYVLEVPRPNREIRTSQIGVELWQALDARALLIAGADGLPFDPKAASTDPTEAGNEEGESPPNPDPVRAGNLETPFHAFHQSLDRSAEQAFDFVQIRGIASYRPITADVVLGMGQPEASGRVGPECWGQLSAPLSDLVAAWNSCQLADGSEDLYILSGAGVPQLEYSRELGRGRGRVLWFSAGLRERFAAPRTSSIRRSSVIKGLAQVGFDIIDFGEAGPEDDQVMIGAELTALNGPLRGRLEHEIGLDGRPRRPVDRQGFDQALHWGIRYAETGNLHALRALRELEGVASDLRVEARVGRDSGEPYLLIEYVGEAIGKRALIVLDYRLDGQRKLSSAELSFDAVLPLRAALLERPQVLIVEDIAVQPRMVPSEPKPEPEHRDEGGP